MPSKADFWLLFFMIVDIHTYNCRQLLKLQSIDVNKASGSELGDAQLTEFQMSQAEYIWYLDTFCSETESGPIMCLESVMKEIIGDDWETQLKKKGDFMEVVPKGTQLFMLKTQREELLYYRRMRINKK